MATTRDYYDILGVEKGATDSEIKRAFRSRARQYHPDVNKSADAETRFKEISEAYEVLGDSRKRATYDRFGHTGQASADGFADFGGFADIFETFFGAGSRHGTSRGPQRGADLRYDMRISFEEAVFGAEKEIEIPTMQPCETCAGSGAEPGSSVTICNRCGGSGELRRVQQSVFGQFVNVVLCDRCNGEGRVPGAPCHACYGEGRARRSKKLTVNVPGGVDGGQQIRLSGEGEIGPKGGPPGDLYIVLSVEEHPLFVREGTDIYLELPLNIAQAALGDNLEVPTLDGDVDLRVPAGTQHGHRFRLRGKGVPHLRSHERGSMYVVAKVVTPTRLTDRQRELFEELAQELGAKEGEKGFFRKMKDAFTA